MTPLSLRDPDHQRQTLGSRVRRAEHGAFGPGVRVGEITTPVIDRDDVGEITMPVIDRENVREITTPVINRDDVGEIAAPAKAPR